MGARLHVRNECLEHFPSRLLTKSASGVLTSLRGSTSGPGKEPVSASSGLDGQEGLRFAFKTRPAHRLAGVHKRGAHLLRAVDLAAALLDGLSEQPAAHSDGVRVLRHDSVSEVITWFVNTLLVTWNADGRLLRLFRHAHHRLTRQ